MHRSVHEAVIQPLRQGTDSHPLELSNLDHEIVRILQRDARSPFTHLARELRVTEKTVRQHVNTLRSTGAISIIAAAHPELFGFMSSALLGLRVASTIQPSEVARALANLKGVDYVVVSTGRYQVLAELLCRDESELMGTIEDLSMRMPEITTCETFPYLRLYYYLPDWDSVNPREFDRTVPRAQPVNDPVDRQIILTLNEDGRMPLTQIAERVGVSESLVRQRVNRLLESNAIRIVAITNPTTERMQLVAWLAIVTCAGAKRAELADQIAECDAVTYLAICGGRFDILAEVVCSSRSDLLEFLDGEIQSIPGVRHVETWVCMDLHYNPVQPDWWES